MFQHTAARRRLDDLSPNQRREILFQHTAARRRLVSTGPIVTTVPEGFNTQPPEGGWQKILIPFEQNTGFNTQPPEGGWVKRIFECT